MSVRSRSLMSDKQKNPVMTERRGLDNVTVTTLITRVYKEDLSWRCGVIHIVKHNEVMRPRQLTLKF